MYEKNNSFYINILNYFKNLYIGFNKNDYFYNKKICVILLKCDNKEIEDILRKLKKIG